MGFASLRLPFFQGLVLLPVVPRERRPTSLRSSYPFPFGSGDPTLLCSTKFCLSSSSPVFPTPVSFQAAARTNCSAALGVLANSLGRLHPTRSHIQVDSIFSLASACLFPSAPADFGVARGLSERPLSPLRRAAEISRPRAAAGAWARCR